MEPQRPSITKKVDESWKESVEKERQTPSSVSAGSAGAQAPEEDDNKPSPFINFISSLAMQAMAALGRLPMEGLELQEPEPAIAKQVIDTLLLLKDKTKGNLTKKEFALLENLLYELQMAFVEATKPPR